MVYESSYESGRKPFTVDAKRGKWESPSDFVLASVGLALKMDIFTITWWFYYEIGVVSLIPYLIFVALYLVPMLVIQLFIGQFSSSGFISAFRLSPFFKGIGYVSIVLNLAMPIYYTIFAAVPVFFIINALRPIMPWSCEGWSNWAQNLTESERYDICNVTARYTESDITQDDLGSEENVTVVMYHFPSVLYITHQFKNLDFHTYQNADYEIWWSLVGCSVLVWLAIAFIFHKFAQILEFGRFLRYTFCTTLALLLICMLRFVFLPGASHGIALYFTLSYDDLLNSLLSVPLFAIQSFGGGWGAIITLASFNHFKTNIISYSWIICLGQMIVITLFGIVSFMLQEHFKQLSSADYLGYVENHWILYLSSASAIANLEWPNLWTITFYSMLLLAAIVVMVTQINSVLLSLFDEFDSLRERRQQVTFTLIALLAVLSLYFCSNHGILYFAAITVDSLITQTFLYLLLIVITLWIYGRERFQRDIEFMIGRKFHTWKVNLLRFAAPVFLTFILLITFFIAYHEHLVSSPIVQGIAVALVVVPFLCIPVYGFFIIFQTTGNFCARFRRSCRPTDWYPIQNEDRQRYEEAVGNMEMTHQLHEIAGDELYMNPYVPEVY